MSVIELYFSNAERRDRYWPWRYCSLRRERSACPVRAYSPLPSSSVHAERMGSLWLETHWHRYTVCTANWHCSSCFDHWSTGTACSILGIDADADCDAYDYDEGGYVQYLDQYTRMRTRWYHHAFSRDCIPKGRHMDDRIENRRHSTRDRSSVDEYQKE